MITSKPLTEYVAGFLFSEDQLHVALISKLRPDFMAGKLNGVGGKIEAGETPLQAMTREFFEEAGATVTDWRQFAVLNLMGPGTRVFFFAAFGDVKIEQNKTDEPVLWVEVAEINKTAVVPNLRWLIPLALDKDAVTAVVFDNSR